MERLADFAQRLYNKGDKIAYKYLSNGEIVEKSYKDLSLNTTSVKAFLLDHYGERKKVAIISESRYDWITLCLGIYASNNIVESIDYNLTPSEIKEILEFAKADIIFISKKRYQVFDQITADFQNLYVIEESIQKIYDYHSDTTCVIHSEDLGQLLFTSGTTSSKKGVMLSYSNIEYEVFNDELQFDDSVMISLLPMYHCFELFCSNLFRLHRGATICINDDINNLLNNMQLFKPTFITLVPALANKFCDLIDKMGYDTFKKLTGGNLTTISLGGASIEKCILEVLKKNGIAVYQGYGLTETTSCALATRPSNNVLGTVGTAMNEHIHVKLSEENEIMISGKTVMLGYYNNKEATEQAIQDGWLYTGDIGEYGENVNIIILGRKVNKIVLNNGKNIFPEELEEKIVYMKNVSNCIVYEENNRLNALIQVNENQKDTNAEIIAEINQFNETLAPYKKIYRIDFTTKKFPITTSNKIKRQKLLSELSAYISREKISKKEIFNKITEIMESKEEFSYDKDIYSCGFDSISTMELSCLLDCNPQDIYRNPTVDQLYTFLNSRDNTTDSQTDINQYIAWNGNLEKPFQQRDVLLTGATGYLGSHILEKLAKQKNQVYCLVRDPEKLAKTYKYYFNKKLPSNINVIEGNIEKAMFGLSQEDYLMYMRKINTVIHSAANVSHIAKYEEMYKTNVEGTKNIIKFCYQSNSILHYMSTYSVSGIGLCDQTKKSVFDEFTLDVGQRYTGSSPFLCVNSFSSR